LLTGATEPSASPGRAPAEFWARRPAQPAPTDRGDRLDSRRNTVTRVYQLQLTHRPNERAEPVLPVEPGLDDIDDIVAAAQPPLDLLASRGLLDAGPGRSEGA